MFHIILSLLNAFKVTFRLVCRCQCFHVCECVYVHARTHMWRSKDSFWCLDLTFCLVCRQGPSLGVACWVQKVNCPRMSRFSLLCLPSHFQRVGIPLIIAASSFYIESGIQMLLLILMWQVLYHWAISPALILMLYACLMLCYVYSFNNQHT